eukprot:3909491-Pyramimonas_sp.AAC.1
MGRANVAPSAGPPAALSLATEVYVGATASAFVNRSSFWNMRGRRACRTSQALVAWCLSTAPCEVRAPAWRRVSERPPVVSAAQLVVP